MSNDSSGLSPGMSATDTAMIIAGVSSAIVAIVYSLRHLSKSSCCCISCDQVVGDIQQEQNQEINNRLEISTV